MHGVPGREIIRSVGDQIIAADQRRGVVRRQPLLMQNHVDAGIEGRGGTLGADRLGEADMAGRMRDLPVQIAEIDVVVVDDADPAYAGGGQIEKKR